MLRWLKVNHPKGSYIKFTDFVTPADATFTPYGKIVRFSKYTDHSRYDPLLDEIRKEEAPDVSENFGSWIPAPISREGEYKSLSNYRADKRMFPDWFKTYLFDYWDREIYTTLGEEAFKPLSFDDVLKAIPASSLAASPGFPWVLAGYTTKRRVIDEHRDWLLYVYNTDFCPTYAYTICPKNELRPVEKANENKIRTFCIANIEHMIVMLKYFGRFLDSLCRIADHRFSMIGFSQYHGYWDTFVRRYLGYHCWAKDGSKFDFRVISQFIEWFFEWFSTHAKCQSVQYDLLTFMTCIKTIITVEGYFFTAYDGNPSGHLLTAVLNTFFNSALNYYAFAAHCRPMTSDHTYSLHNDLVIERLLGDDALEGVKEGYEHFWNFDIECKYLFGFLEYTTNSDPGSVVDQDFLSLRTTFDPLTRNFVPYPFSTRWVNSIVNAYNDLSVPEKLHKLISIRTHCFYNPTAFEKVSAIATNFMNRNRHLIGHKAWDDALRSYRTPKAIRALYHHTLE